jgi:kumamolisin
MPIDSDYAWLQSHLTYSVERRLSGLYRLAARGVEEVINVSLKLRRKCPLPALAGRPAKPLTRQQLGDQFGATSSDIDAVANAFAPFGLKVIEKNPATRTVELSGTIAATEQAFQVKLFNYKHESGDYRGRVGVVSVPSAVKEIVQGVFGLDNRRVVRRRPPADAQARKHMTSVPSAWYMPSQLATHYNFPGGDGGGQTVGLLEFGGGYFASASRPFANSRISARLFNSDRRCTYTLGLSAMTFL